MRCLVDECAGPAVAEWLRGLGHEVCSIYDESPGLDDTSILAKASDENRILITADKDFGEKVYRDRASHCGVVLLRLRDERAASKIDALRKLLNDFAGRLPDEFVVVTETQVRFARS